MTAQISFSQTSIIVDLMFWQRFKAQLFAMHTVYIETSQVFRMNTYYSHKRS
jgi:hypothetical protein